VNFVARKPGVSGVGALGGGEGEGCSEAVGGGLDVGASGEDIEGPSWGTKDCDFRVFPRGEVIVDVYRQEGRRGVCANTRISRANGSQTRNINREGT
jgi:hypothetical protein